MPKVDATDFYMFRSYEPGRAGLRDPDRQLPARSRSPYGGPNYFTIDPNALYEIHVDNNGDAVEDITFQFRFKNTLRDIQLPIAGKQVSIPLVQAGGISAPEPGRPATCARPTRSTWCAATAARARAEPVIDGRRRHRVRQAGRQHRRQDLRRPDRLRRPTPTSIIYAVNIPGCGTPGRVFVGQRKDPFAVALGKIFDLINLNPLGATERATATPSPTRTSPRSRWKCRSPA